MKFDESDRLRPRARRLIPGGAHTYAKGDDQYPVRSPGFIARGAGCRVWDPDGNEFIEYNMGNRAVILGHAYKPVIEAAQRELSKGANFSRPSVIEADAAEAFLGLIDTSDMVKFCKDGSDATSGAIRLARAATGRDRIAICADHPFFATNDWFIATTPIDAGIPKANRDLVTTFSYNDIESARAMFAANQGRIAAVMLEPAKNDDPADGFLEKLKELAHANGALFILDENITGFRWHARGAHRLYGVTPDLACWGKGLGNGFSVSALSGAREIMELGGLEHDRERVFLLSTTHGGETHALAAAMAVIDAYQRLPVVEHMERVGARLRAGVEQVAARHGLSDHVQLFGRPSCMVFSTLDQERRPSQEFRSLFLQETIARGVLCTSFVVSYAHQDEDIDQTIEAVDGAMGVYKQALENGVENHLVGRPSQTVYRKYNHPTKQAAE